MHSTRPKTHTHTHTYLYATAAAIARPRAALLPRPRDAVRDTVCVKVRLVMHSTKVRIALAYMTTTECVTLGVRKDDWWWHEM